MYAEHNLAESLGGHHLNGGRNGISGNERPKEKEKTLYSAKSCPPPSFKEARRRADQLRYEIKDIDGQLARGRSHRRVEGEFIALTEEEQIQWRKNATHARRKKAEELAYLVAWMLGNDAFPQKAFKLLLELVEEYDEFSDEEFHIIDHAEFCVEAKALCNTRPIGSQL